MKRTLLSFFLLVITTLALKAQTSASAPPRCLFQRNTYVCTELALSDEECESVSSLLNELDTQRIALWKEHRERTAQLRNKKDLTKEDVIKHLKERTEWKTRESKLIEECYIKLCDQISPEKVLLLEHTQRKFGRSLMNKKSPSPIHKSQREQKNSQQRRR
ncbi:hypothetical protein [Porphyromonas circumdentaria]|uniref:LTXXQ motif family protein n=1 Tax=Porphyromonas circumdentaria TaxID=29524 RepID=A0A1T4NPP9_9PORP|nr:hypothetical protein [Porphyromonas circumdentaria]MBB6276158.1 hypothetical protein [Porphyromonas circumdentaria]SJZ81214.1 hypothetical protein SAMN02745171_01189 [Porphyromonas circumdentaria]